MTEDNVFNDYKDQLIFFNEIICPWKHINVSVSNFLFPN
jgi:hypothetical protein